MTPPEKSERETPRTEALLSETMMMRTGPAIDKVIRFSRDLERENARLKEELEETHRNAARIAANYTLRLNG
jgi:hypothetical protein